MNEKLLPLADYYGTTYGKNVKDKMKIMPTVEHGRVFDVPTIAESPVVYELRVQKEVHLFGNSDVFICEICNVAVEESLSDKNVPFIDRLKKAAPVLTCGENTYESIDGRYLGG